MMAVVGPSSSVLKPTQSGSMSQPIDGITIKGFKAIRALDENGYPA